MIGVLDLTVVDCGFEFRSCQAKDFKISLCCSCVYHLALSNKTHDSLAGGIRYLHDVDLCVSEPALWKLTRYVGLLQASSSFHQQTTWDDPVVRRKLIWQSEKEDMMENYKFLVSLRKKSDSEVKRNISEQEITAPSPPHPTPIYTLDKNMDVSLLMSI